MNRLLLFLACLWASLTLQAREIVEASPNGQIQLTLTVEDQLTYAVTKDGAPILETAPLRIIWSNGIDMRPDQLEIVDVIKTDYAGERTPIVGFASSYPNTYREVRIQFKHSFEMVWRIYNQGVAWRFVSKVDPEQGSQALFVFDEQCEFAFAGDPIIYYPQVGDFMNSFEENYLNLKRSSLPQESMALTPTLVKTEAGPFVLISEADLRDYPGMYLRPSAKGLQADFPAYVTRESQEILGRLGLTQMAVLSGMDVRKRAKYLAKTQTGRVFPWRVALIADTEKDLFANPLIYALGTEHLTGLPPMDWVTPGKVAWDWYHKWQIEGVPFEPGINTETYLYYIDFAAANGFQYINLDEGWTHNRHLLRVNKDIDIEQIVSYANEKGIGVFLWMIWWVLEKDMTRYLDQFEAWGVAGLKVDFLDRDDQQLVQFCEKLAKEAANRKLLINYHGAYKPTGLAMAYPNIINWEGVVGLENNKFSERCTPQHNLTIPFTRNVVGPMDYTPGAMRYVKPENFTKNWSEPAAMTTRMQQLAMYIVYYGPLQMISDAPHLYPAEALAFLKEVPTVWDESMCLEGSIGESIVVARRQGDRWFVGGMVSAQSMTYTVDLAFLQAQTPYTYTLYQDGEALADIVSSKGTVRKGDKIEVQMKPNGGFTLMLFPQ